MKVVEAQEQQQIAVWGRALSKGYGRGKSKLAVLKDLEITVPKGAIYGLLGPSGCGKTTLLRCIVGRLAIDRGHLFVLGDKPGNYGHDIPGSLVGYMPQEMALFDKLTIGETLSYFGRLHSMGHHHVQERTAFLLEFLTLPEHNRLIGSLSGGQKRRVSFSVALLHEPELLILDEPTVGVDPILRERIWEHMIKIARQEGKESTVIITTHYIEEARQADMVGLMRNGKLLAEEKPSLLIDRFRINTLEAVFLKLCHEDQVIEEGPVYQNSSLVNDPRQQHRVQNSPSVNSPRQRRAQNETSHLLLEDNTSSQDDSDDSEVNHKLLYTGHSHSNCHCPIGCPSPQNIFAQVVKNVILMRRNIGFLLFDFMLPAIQILLFCVCVGRDPYDLHVAIVNNETHGIFQFGKEFIQTLDNNTIHKVVYHDMNEALLSVKEGHNWGVIGIGKNFSMDLITRFTNSSGVTNSTIEGGTVKLYLDMTNQQISILLQAKVQLAFQTFTKNILKTVNKNPSLANSPVSIEPPIYGDKNPSFTNFMAPGIILSIIFFMATGLTTLQFVVEKKEGLLDRSLVAGMTPFDIILAHVFTQLFVMMIQVAALLAIILGVFSVPSQGPLIWVILLTLLQGFCGMTLGVLFSSVCEQETSAVQLALGSVYPMLLISGIIWPLEAIPEWMRYISVCMPTTYAAEAMRNILSRGWTITSIQVWHGFLVTLGWSFGLLALSGFILRVKG